MKVNFLSKGEIEKEVSNIIIDEIKNNPSCVLGLATGSSPLGVYQRLIDAYRSNMVSFKDVTTFNLDEYMGLDEYDINSYHYYMNHNLFNHIDINKDNIHIPNGFVKTDEEAVLYDDEILKAGGIDVLLLGLGKNGHIGFNEPYTSFSSLSHITCLSEQTINDNARFFDDVKKVPSRANTMGLKSIMNAKKIILIVLGCNKIDAVNELLNDEISVKWPCTILKKHLNCTVFIENVIIDSIF